MTKTLKNRIRLITFFSLTISTLSCSSNSTPSISDESVSEIAWKACDGKDAPKSPFECGSVLVPLDYSNPDGEKISIALIRIPAMREAAYAGVILFNPGGPGGSGFDSMVSYGQDLAKNLDTSSFDLISFDPRGVDRSGGLRCYTDEELDKFLYLDSTPDTDLEQALFDESEKDDSTCEEKLGPSIKFYSTENIARDMDVIRAGLRVEKISYLGISYGTYLGGVYATLFPDRVESMVLDAPFDPQGDSLEQSYLTQATGFERAFANWVDWCEKETECKFRSADVAKKWDELYARLDKKSALAKSGREVNHEVMMDATKYTLYSEFLWPILADALQQAEEGKPDSLLDLADSDNNRQEDGTYLTSVDSFYLIHCASGFEKPLPDNPSEIVKKLKQVAPWYSRGFEISDFDEPQCEEVFKKQKLFEIDYQGNAPILIIGGENDPATPIRWAEEMLLSLGTNASLVRFSGEGHSQILSSKCVDTYARLLFTRKTLPTSNAVCDPDQPVPEPSWWADIPPAAIIGEPLNTSEIEELLSLSNTDSFNDFRAATGNLDVLYAQVYEVLVSAEYSTDCNLKVAPIKKACFFWQREGDYLGLLMISNEEIEEWRINQPDLPIPSGANLINFYYWP